MATIGKIVIGLSVKTGKLSKSLHEASGFLGKFKVSALAAGAGILALGGSAVAVGWKLKNMTQEAMSSLDEMSKFSDEVGLTIEQWRGYSQFAAGLSGANSDTVKKSFQILTKAMGEAKQGIGEVTVGLKDLGFTQNDFENLSTHEAFKKISESISNLPGPTEKAAASFRIFGEDGANMATFLNSGAEAIQGAIDESIALAGSLNRIDTRMIENANDSMAKFDFVLQSVGTYIAIELAPYIDALYKKLTETGKQGVNVGVAVSESFGWIIETGALVGDIIDTLVLGFKFLQAGVTSFIAQTVGQFSSLIWLIEKVINLHPAVDNNVAGTMMDVQSSLNDLAGDQLDGAWNKFLDDPAGTKFKKMLDDIQESAKKMATIVGDSAEKGIGKMSDALKTANDNAGAMITKLKDSISTFGMSSTAAEIYRLRQMGVNEAVLENIAALDAKHQKMIDSQQADLDAAALAESIENNWKSMADALKSSVETPLEKYKKDMSDIKILEEKGLISATTRARSTQKVINDYLATLTGDEGTTTKQKTSFGLTGASAFGSAAARTTVLNNRFSSNDPMTKIEKHTKKQAEENEKQTGYLETIAKNNTGAIAEMAF